MKKAMIIFVSLLPLLFEPVSLLDAQVQDTPPSVAAALLVKLAAFEKNISSGGEVSIYVMGDNAVAKELEKGIGQSIGNAVLKSVQSGDFVPQQKPSILYVGNALTVEDAIAYTRQNKVLSATGLPGLVPKGVTLGFAIGPDGKPKIQVNLSSTVEEDVSWNFAIMKIATTYK